MRRALLTAVVGAVAACGGTHEAPIEASFEDARADDVRAPETSTLPSCLVDGGPVSDWPGWHRTTGLDGCCMTSVPDDLASIPPLAWKPCDDAGAGCSMLDMTWQSVGIDPIFRGAFVSRGADGRIRYFDVVRWLAQGNEVTWEHDVYDVSTNVAVGAWRVDESTLFVAAQCTIEPIPTPSGVTLFAIDQRPTLPYALYSAHGTVDDMLDSPSMVRFAGTEAPNVSGVRSSDTTLALAVQGSLLRLPVGTGSSVHVAGWFDAMPSFVEGDDAFFTTVGGAVILLRADGSTAVAREHGGRHVAAPATDGETLFWIENVDDVPDAAPPLAEVWAAGYSNDPAAINIEAHSLVTIPLYSYYATGVAFRGIFALQVPDKQPYLYAVRRDGWTATIQSPDPSIHFDQPFYVDEGEVWTFARGPEEAYGSRILRLALPPFQ